MPFQLQLVVSAVEKTNYKKYIISNITQAHPLLVLGVRYKESNWLNDVSFVCKCTFPEWKASSMPLHVSLCMGAIPGRTHEKARTVFRPIKN